MNDCDPCGICPPCKAEHPHNCWERHHPSRYADMSEPGLREFDANESAAPTFDVVDNMLGELLGRMQSQTAWLDRLLFQIQRSVDDTAELRDELRARFASVQPTLTDAIAERNARVNGTDQEGDR